METWSTHHLYQQATDTLGSDIASALQNYSQQLISKGLAVVFTLGHLSKITGVSYKMLKDSVNRDREHLNYRMYSVKKRSGGLRFIHSVFQDLLKVQQFINQEILQKCTPHSSSFAFHQSGGIRKCAAMHCGARWLFQFDLTDFFYDVTEIDIYHIFESLGYRHLLAFELARLCTTTYLPRKKKHFAFYSKDNGFTNSDLMLPYNNRYGAIGVLPQGAPTSPMLSNLASQKLDELLYKFSFERGFIYTRYADDITISASTFPKNEDIGKIYRSVVRIIRKARFKENKKKIRIAGPGSKKVVLGLLVDGKEPRITKETYHRIDRYLHASLKYGLSNTASHEGFDSAFGFSNHLSGLIAFVKDVDNNRWKEFSERFICIENYWN